MTTVTAGRARRRERARRRTSVGVALVLFLALVGGVAWAASYYRSCAGAAPGPRRPLVVRIERGATWPGALDDLHARGVIPCGGIINKLLFRGTAGSDAVLRAGVFELTTGMTLEEAVQVLATPPPDVPTVELVVPEGLRLTEIADRVEADLGISAERFLAEAQSGTHALPPYLVEGKPTPEGFLFPKTYEFAREGLTAGEVISELLHQFEHEASRMPFVITVERLGVTPYEVVIIASMIEEEARVARDRPLIAGVIYNRLEREMPLGIDATLLYDDPTPDGELSSADLESDSPYNTRINVGLPPTPIASPGRASLRAALEPAETDYLYYVLCGEDGGHRFALTYEEHLRNVDECPG